MYKKEFTLCWDCSNYAKRSWSRGIPVEGWVARPRIISKDYMDGRGGFQSYCVIECPEFDRDAEGAGQRLTKWRK